LKITLKLRKRDQWCLMQNSECYTHWYSWSLWI